MNQSIFTFQSMTEVTKARRMLSKEKISFTLAKRSSVSNKGCLYTLRVPGDSYLSAIRALREGGVSYRIENI